MKLCIAAGGTGGHIFPALSVVLEWRRREPKLEVLWFGTERSRERELCELHKLSFVPLKVSGIQRLLSLHSIKTLVEFYRGFRLVRSMFGKERPDVIIAFGGYVSAPVLAAARIMRIPYFLHEQNTVPGLVNRLFSRGARCNLLSFPLCGAKQVRGAQQLVGMPVRPIARQVDESLYPAGLDKTAPTVLICGGSQGALSMNRLLVNAVKGWLKQGIQVVWQTGTTGLEEAQQAVAGLGKAFVFDAVSDMYPFYAIARVVVGRGGASTLAEVGYFGLPMVIIPLPWAADNHQWTNAGLVEGQGWGIRVAQNPLCGEQVDKQVRKLLSDDALFEQMSRKALDFTPVNAAATIVQTVVEMVEGTNKS
jgi:UDP-N-acetylglucosamine--N-acetylmuramyl-(pentapeptide) pyrophosphoryl-undecaprenol N-acetylglucosamine transferase